MKRLSGFLVKLPFLILKWIYGLFKRLKLTDLPAKLYNKWVLTKYGFRNCSFHYPVNAIVGSEYIDIGYGTGFGRLAVVTAWDNYEGESFTPQIKIGSGCSFGDYVHITCINSIIIGDHVLTGRWVTISDNGHGDTSAESLDLPPLQRPLYSKGGIKIGDKVWIGDKATILAGVSIGKGAVVAANSVVTKDVPPYAVVAGNPARIIRQN